MANFCACPEGDVMHALIKAFLRPLLCARCGRQLHECACDEVATQLL
jgi:transcription initiation factor IIE alpha subunit